MSVVIINGNDQEIIATGVQSFRLAKTIKEAIINTIGEVKVLIVVNK